MPRFDVEGRNVILLDPTMLLAAACVGPAATN